MREIVYTKTFKKDYKRLQRSGQYDMDELHAVFTLLADDIPLPQSCREHRLTGDWEGYCECHVRPDWLLIYGREGDDVLFLERTGSHTELFD